MNNNQLTSSPPVPGELRRASKREKYLLKKQRKEQERLRKTRRKKIKKIVGISIVSLVVILITGGIIWGISSYLSRSNQGVPEMTIISQEHDAGTVSMAAGLVEHTYEIKNIGVGDLKINRIWTSCMCTTARLRVRDKESGEFGMHSKSGFWSQKIAPGETGYLKVTFDPAFHGPGGTGSVVRAVYLSTDDPKNKTAEIKLLVNVIK